jgi:cell division protein FtsQ
MTSGVRGRRVRRPVLPPDDPPEDEERRPSRHSYLRRRWIALAVVLGVLGTAYLVIFTSMFGVRTVEVSGVTTIPADTVRAAAAIELGTPLVRLDTEEVRARVAALPKVFSVEVSRSFPSTVEIAVVERAPVAMVTAADGVHLIDGTGLDYEVVKQALPGLPELTVDQVRPDDPATRSAVAVLAAIPQQLRAQLVKITAKTAGNVQLSLADGRLVKWGSAESSERKAAVLAPLLTRPGKVYDVATPEFPTVS